MSSPAIANLYQLFLMYGGSVPLLLIGTRVYTWRMPAISQIQMRYAPDEDRVLLRLNTTAGEEFRFWITRRYTALLAKAIAAHRASDPDVGTQLSDQDRQVVEQFKQEAADAQANFSEGFQASESYPLGAEPILAHKLTFKVEAGKLALTMEPKEGQGISISLDHQLNFSFTKLLQQAAATAEWGLNLTQLTATDAPGQRRVN